MKVHATADVVGEGQLSRDEQMFGPDFYGQLSRTRGGAIILRGADVPRYLHAEEQLSREEQVFAEYISLAGRRETHLIRLTQRSSSSSSIAKRTKQADSDAQHASGTKRRRRRRSRHRSSARKTKQEDEKDWC